MREIEIGADFFYIEVYRKLKQPEIVLKRGGSLRRKLLPVIDTKSRKRISSGPFGSRSLLLAFLSILKSLLEDPSASSLGPRLEVIASKEMIRKNFRQLWRMHHHYRHDDGLNPENVIKI